MNIFNFPLLVLLKRLLVDILYCGHSGFLIFPSVVQMTVYKTERSCIYIHIYNYTALISFRLPKKTYQVNSQTRITLYPHQLYLFFIKFPPTRKSLKNSPPYLYSLKACNFPAISNYSLSPILYKKHPTNLH